MTAPMTAQAVLEREFLKARAKILEVGAILDRVDRADGDATGDRRRELLRRGVEVLLEDEPDRAEKIQMIFSLPHRKDWREEFGIE